MTGYHPIRFHSLMAACHDHRADSELRDRYLRLAIPAVFKADPERVYRTLSEARQAHEEARSIEGQDILRGLVEEQHQLMNNHPGGDDN